MARTPSPEIIARINGRITKANDAMDPYELHRDALAMIDIPDRVYGDPEFSNPLNLLGLAKHKGNPRSFIRLLHLEKLITADQEHELAVKSKIQLLEDGMLDARPRTEEAKKITEHNAMTSPVLNLPAEIRNRIFAFAMGGNQVFVSSDPRPWKEYLDIEEERMTHYIAGTCPPSYSKYLQDAESLMTAKITSGSLTCRQFYAETALLPFSRINRFWYSNDDSLKMLIECLKPAQLRAITHLFFTVRSIEDFNFERLENLDKLEGVKRIDVEGADMCSMSLGYVETGLGEKIREKASRGVQVVFRKRELKD